MKTADGRDGDQYSHWSHVPWLSERAMGWPSRASTDICWSGLAGTLWLP